MKTPLIPILIVVLLSAYVFSSAPAEAQITAQYGFEGNVLDTSGNGLNGINHGVSFTTNAAIGGQAGVFNGSSYVGLNNASMTGPLKPALPVTISAWVYLTSTTVNERIFSSDNTDDISMLAGYDLSILSGQLACDYCDAGGAGSGHRRTIVGTAALLANQWYHVAAVIQGETNMQLYVNGQQINGNYSGTGLSMKYTSAPSNIGTSGSTNFFNGYIDSVQIYNSALTASQVALLAQGSMGYWALNEGSGTTTADATGNGFTGSLINSPAWTNGVDGYGLLFNGANNYVNLNNTSMTSPLKPNLPVSIGAWGYLNSTSGAQRIFSSDNTDDTSTTTIAGYDLSVVSGNLVCEYGDAQGPYSQNRRSKTGTTTLTTGHWYYLSAVIQGATNMTLYVNGVDDGGTYSGTGGNMGYTSASSKIATSTSTNFLNGILNDVSVYNSVLSPYDLGAPETIGGGTVSSPAVGPAPSYGVGGTGFTLVENWHFGTDGTIKDSADLDKYFQYHDENGTVDNGGQYGAQTVAEDQAHAIQYQRYVGESLNGVTVPAVRSFTTDSMRTYVVPLGGATTLIPSQHNSGCGSFEPIWTLPKAGSKLGQDLLWETRVRYVIPKYFWFSLWTSTRPYLSGYGPEQDMVETFGYDDGGTPDQNNFNGIYFHSNTVGGTDINKYLNWGASMSSFGINSYDPTQYHVWTWLFRKDDTYAMYVDGTQVQYGTAPYPWTSTGTTSGTAEPVYFFFDAGLGSNKSKNDDFNLPVSGLAGTYYEFNYSRVYLR